MSKPYTVFTTEFDTIISGAELSKRSPGATTSASGQVSPENLDTYNALAQKISSEDAIEFITSLPEEYTHVLQNSAISVLVDHSGSLLANGGAGSIIARLTLDSLATLFCQLNVKHEILGFTTNTWHGGKSREKWKRRWIYRQPGRLCDLLHIIYRTYDDVSRAPSPYFSNLFRPDLLKENVDGEAIEWAIQRLRNRSEAKKILIFIADGAPVDDSTLQNNPFNYLSEHCSHVLETIKAKKDIEVFGLGVNYNLEPMYENSLFLGSAEHTSQKVFDYIREGLIPQILRPPSAPSF